MRRRKFLKIIGGRSKHVEITKAGQDIFFQTVAKLEPYFTKMASEIPSGDILSLTATLTKIRIYMDTARDEKI